METVINGPATTETISDPAADNFAALARRVREAGLLNRRRGYYVVKVGLTVLMLGAAWVAVVLVGNSWATLGLAAILGLLFTQLGFVGHDAGHQQVCVSRAGNRLLGLLVGDLLIGVSFGWWVPKHSAHHAHPNQESRDPDIGEAVIALGSGRVASFLDRRQAWLFFPLMLLRTIGLHVSGVQMLVRRRDRSAALELSLLILHAASYLTVLLLVLSPLKALAFVVLQQAVFSVYLGCSFAPNHKGMPILPEHARLSFARRQVVTARNITGSRVTDLVLGGLNYQIEHHLFPTMPRPNLARAQGLIRAFCADNRLDYCEVSMAASFAQILRHLSAKGAGLAIAPV